MNRNYLKILIVEDDLIIAENLKENLVEMGYENVSVAINSDEAIIQYNNSSPDLLLVDIQLNNSSKDGIETIKYLDVGNDVPVIYLTAFADELTRKRAKSTHPSAYLIKPASKAQIDISIDIAMSNFYGKNSNLSSQSCPLFARKNHIFIKSGERYEKCNFADIVYIKAEGSYSRIYSKNKNWMVSMYLNKLIGRLHNDTFIRCHRSYVVNLTHVHSFDRQFVYVVFNNESHGILLSDHYKENLKEHFPFI